MDHVKCELHYKGILCKETLPKLELMFMKHYAPNRCLYVHKGGKIKNWGGECRDVTPTKLQSQNIFKESTGGGGQDGCERKIKVFVKIQKKKYFFLGGGGGGGQGRCEQRSEVFAKIKKKKLCGGGGGSVQGGGGVRVDVNEELKFL